MRVRRLHLPLVAMVAACVLALAGAPAASAACGSTSSMAGQASKRALASATVCLVNGERAERGLRPLRVNRRLSRAARVHARDMVRRDYFAHDSLSGDSFVDRIRRAGYLRGPRAWVVGENLAWGSGNRSTPASIVRAWMNSPGHRANILQRRFREIGIGLVLGAPENAGGPAATYATDFGARG